MSKVDDELTSRFHRAERPVDDDALFQSLERRRSHRERVGRIQTGGLAVAVIAATVVGFVGLRAVFDESGTDVGEPSGLPRNGEIVFSKRGDDGRFHLFGANPDGSGERQITADATNDTDPAVSPDGKTIAFVHELDQGVRVIATVPIEGGTVTRITVEEASAHDPSWSPDGTRLAYVGASRFEGSLVEDSVLYVIRLDRPEEEPLALLHNVAIAFADPGWSPAGDRLAVAARDLISHGVMNHWVIVEVGIPDPLQPDLPLRTEVDEHAPAWSPDGERIAFVRAGAEGDEVWTRSPEGASEILVARAVEASLELDLAWAPDGTALLVSDGEWVYRVDPTPDGDPRENFVQLFRGFAPSWQPIPAATGQPSPASTPEPTVTASPAPEGRDIGLGVMMCDLQVLEGIDWDGTGIDGSAWTGAPVDEDGTCTSAELAQHVVAVDRDGDGVAEQGATSTLRCLLCRPFATVDLNDDGVLELVVLEEASSTPTYSVYEVNRPGSERAEGVYPLIVIPPGAREMDLDPNERVRFTVGGDEGFSGGIECEDGSDGPVLRYTWVRGAVDADTDLDVDVTRLRFGEDGVFKVLSVDSFTVPRNPEPTDLISREPACGVDFHPDA